MICCVEENNNKLLRKCLVNLFRIIQKKKQNKLSDCAVMSDGEYCGYYCSDIHDILRELEDEYEIRS